MKIATNTDNNRLEMKTANTPDKDTLESLYDEGYAGRVYRTALVVWAVAAAMAYVYSGLRVLIGLSYGAAVAMTSFATIELMVKCLLRPGRQMSPARLGLLFALKLPLLTAVVAGAAWMAVTGTASIFAIVGGIALVPSVVFMKALGAWMLTTPPAARPIQAPRAAAPAASHRQRGYRPARPEALPAGD